MTLVPMMIADLRSAAELAALLSIHRDHAAVFWLARPTRSELPAITLEGVSTDVGYSQSGPAKLRSRRIQVDAWSLNIPSDALQVFSAARKLIEGGFTNRWRGFQLDERDTFEDLDGDQRIFRTSGDFMIWYQET